MPAARPFLLEDTGSSKATVATIAELMASDYDWACVAMIGLLAMEADWIGRWAESCPMARGDRRI